MDVAGLLAYSLLLCPPMEHCWPMAMVSVNLLKSHRLRALVLPNDPSKLDFTVGQMLYKTPIYS